MSPQIQQMLLTIIVLSITVLLPAVPTAVIYKLFPGQQVSLSGPLQGFTVKAVGAFAAYVVVFLLAIPFVWRVFDQASKFVAPTWTVRANLVALDRNGQSVAEDGALNGLQVRLEPGNYGLAGGQFWVRVPEVENRIPSIVVSVPGYREATINVNEDALQINGTNKAKIQRDSQVRAIRIEDSIELRQPPQDMQYPENFPRLTALPPQ